MKHYDYIIAGAGCAGLSLLIRMLARDSFSKKKILLLDRAPKTENDRTWCFWEKEPGFFESIVYRRWSQLRFCSEQASRILGIHPYAYKMIRGIDFYEHCFRIIGNSSVEARYEEILDICSEQDIAYVKLPSETISSGYVFSSIMPAQLERQAGKHYLWQHFKGWTIRTGEDCFATNIATLMDFRIDQEQGPGFVYLLPLTPGRALVEYTLFSAELLQDEAYDKTLRSYLRTMFPDIAYSIEAEEKGKIPMTNHRFPSSEGRIIYLGTMAGNTKPSSGYTFSFIQAHSEQLLAAMTQSDHPFLPKAKLNRFLWYDSVLLRVLAEGNLPAETIFRRLFTKNNPQSVLRFLNNSSSLIEELRLISSLPVLPFLSAAVKECTNSTKQVSQP